MLSPDRTRQRDHRRRAEQSNPHARRGETRALARDYEIARRCELASRGGGDRMHARDHRLRNPLNRQHQLRAQIEFIPVECEVAPFPFAEVVTGGERWAVAGDYYRARI